MKELKHKAEENCLKKVRMVMSSGLALIAGNIGFIWAGTYVFFSWDIIEPLAYFITAGAGVVLTYQFFKMGRMYSHYNYQRYLFQKYLPGAYESVGFDEKKFDEEKLKMLKLESVIKDHYIRKLS